MTTVSNGSRGRTIDAPSERPIDSQMPKESGPLPSHPMLSYYVIFGSIAILLGFGLLMVLSASSVESFKDNGSPYTLAARQGLFAVLGLGMMFVISRMPVSLFRRFGGIALIVAVVMLFLVFVPGLGVEVYGQRNWIRLFGPFRLQPSEFAKLGLVIWAAALMSRRSVIPQSWRDLTLPLVPVGGFLVVMVLAEGDMGNALILCAILAGILFVLGAPLRLFALGGTVLAVGVFALSLGASYRMARFVAWLHPESDPGGAGWQLIQGKYALGTGGWFGVGLGSSREKWGSLPEAHTDFIFPVIGEETGLVGTIAVLVLIGVFAFASLRIAVRTEDMFVRLAITGIVSWIVFQAITNIGAVLQLLPITGVPLPLVSYGGSSLLPILMGMGMILSFARHQGAIDAEAARESAMGEA